MPDPRPRVLLLETIDKTAMTELADAVVTIPAWSHDAAAVIETARAGRIDAIMTRGKGQVTAALMDACDGLVAIARCGVGLDNVDCAAASSRGVAVLNLPGCNAQTIVEHTVMLMLAVSRRLVSSAVAVERGDWASRAKYDGDELFQKTAGIVGLGNIGTRVASVCEALGMHVVYTDPARTEAPFERVELDELLGVSDVVTLHCQLDDRTRGLIDAATLPRLKAGAVLINTARGALVDHAALAEALRSGAIAGYGADVLDVEPPGDDHPLRGLPNVVVTPHVGSLTRSTYREICVRSVRNVLAVLEDRAPEAGCLFNATQLG